MDLTISTPGRICLFGEHQDYLNLPIIAAAISKRIWISGSHTKDRKIALSLPDIGRDLLLNLDYDLQYTDNRDYFKSSLNVLIKEGLTFSKGIKAKIGSSIPINSGTSSSSALVVSWINFLALMSDQQKKLNPIKIAELAHRAEVLEFNQPGGMMDHYSTAVGNVIFLDNLEPPKVKKLDTNLSTFVLGNSNEPKDTLGILSRLKKSAHSIVSKLNVVDSDLNWESLTIERVNDFDDFLNYEEKIIFEGILRNKRITLDALEIFTSDNVDHKELGELLNKHHIYLRDNLNISTPKIERMINAAIDAGAYGAKINGSGGGGCMFAYCPESPEDVMTAINSSGGDASIITVDEGTRIEEYK